MTTSDKFQRHSFKVAFKLTAKSVWSNILTFGIFENRIAGLDSCEDSIIGAGAGAGAAGAGTFCPEPEPESEPPNSFTRSRSRNAAPEPEPEPEPTKNVTAPHPCFMGLLFHGSNETWSFFCRRAAFRFRDIRHQTLVLREHTTILKAS